MTTQSLISHNSTFEGDPARAEQQRLALLYNVGERQMLRSYRLAAHQPGDPVANLLSLLERRLDNLIYRCGFAPDIFAARRVVTRHHVLVDGRLLGGPYRRVQPGQVITLRARMCQPLALLRWSQPKAAPPPYLEVDFGSLTARLLRQPTPDEMPIPVDAALLAKYYSRAM